jgi:hypothetical protein
MWKENLTLLALEKHECAHSSNFGTLKITEEILRMKLRVGVLNWLIGSVHRSGRWRPGRLILIEIYILMTKLEVLEARRNFAGKNIKVAKDCNVKIRRYRDS